MLGGPTATLSWTAPTQYTDGSTLLHLAGYHIFYGTASRQYTADINLTNPGLVAYVIDDLSAGTYFFAMTAYDSRGAESALSSEVSKVIS